MQEVPEMITKNCELDPSELPLLTLSMPTSSLLTNTLDSIMLAGIGKHSFPYPKFARSKQKLIPSLAFLGQLSNWPSW